MIGTQIAGRFTVDAYLGTVDGRVLYAGRQPALERPVAIKMVEDATDEGLCRRFLREGRLLAKLDHPGIVSVIDVGVHEGRPYVVTEAPKGERLDELLEARGRIDWRAAHDLLISLADAVGCAHAAGLVHRDLHPKNVVVGADGMARITDFVFAYESAPYTDQGTTQLLTSRGAVVGSIEWIAAEQLMGFSVDARADLYALGVLAYRMVAGRVPHQAGRAAEIISLQSSGATPLMAEANLADAARPFAQLVDRLLAPEPDRRGFDDASQLAKALRTMRAMPAREMESRPKPSRGRVAALLERGVRAGRFARSAFGSLITKLAALPRRMKLVIAAGAVVSIAAAAAMVSRDEEVPVAQPLFEAPAVEPSQLALREVARRAADRNDVPRALGSYRALARGAFEAEDHRRVVAYLARPNRNTGVAEEILISAAPGSVPALREAFDGPTSGRYLRRRAGEVLEKLGEPVDLVPLWIGTLSSDECVARRLAVQRLVATGDERAVGPLTRLGRSFSCGGEEARNGLRRIKRSG